MNATSLNDTVELPHWASLTVVNVIIFIGVLLPTTLLMNISVLVALIKSKVKYKPLLVLFGSLLIGVCIDKVIICVGQCVISPSAFRYCRCVKLTVVLFQAPRIFFTVYPIIIVTCLSLSQLWLVKGKLSNSYKQTVICLVISVFVSAFWTLVYIVRNVLSKLPFGCYTLCTVPVGLSATMVAVIYFSAITFAPAFIITIVASIWTFRIFKKSFILQSNTKNEIALNRRMILLPILMAILLVCNSFLAYIVTITSTAILSNSDVVYFYGNWANIIASLEYGLFDIFNGLSFPLVLLYLYTQVRNTWKRLVCKLLCCKCTQALGSQNNTQNNTQITLNSPAH